MTTQWHSRVVAVIVAFAAVTALAIDPAEEAEKRASVQSTVPLCQQLKSRCVCVPYCPKTAPCAPCYALQTACTNYDKKCEPECPPVCFEWCPSIYCKKRQPCFPGDPCERQVWHPAPMAAPCTEILMEPLSAELKPQLSSRRVPAQRVSAQKVAVQKVAGPRIAY
jgi:hypothetical protein